MEGIDEAKKVLQETITLAKNSTAGDGWTL